MEDLYLIQSLSNLAFQKVSGSYVHVFILSLLLVVVLSYSTYFTLLNLNFVTYEMEIKIPNSLDKSGVSNNVLRSSQDKAKHTVGGQSPFPALGEGTPDSSPPTKSRGWAVLPTGLWGQGLWFPLLVPARALGNSQGSECLAIFAPTHTY